VTSLFFGYQDTNSQKTAKIMTKRLTVNEILVKTHNVELYPNLNRNTSIVHSNFSSQFNMAVLDS